MYKSERLLAGIWNEASSYTGCDLIGPSETRAEFRSRSIFFSEPAVGHRDRSPFSEMKILHSNRHRVASHIYHSNVSPFVTRQIIFLANSIFCLQSINLIPLLILKLFLQIARNAIKDKVSNERKVPRSLNFENVKGINSSL